MLIRIWKDNAIVGELDISDDGRSTTWAPKPDMPNNSVKEPDIEIEPFKKWIKLKGYEVTDIPTGEIYYVEADSSLGV